MYWSSLLVFLGDTWKDGVGVDMRRELQGLTWSLGCGIRDEKGRETGRNEVVKPNCYIVAGLCPLLVMRVIRGAFGLAKSNKPLPIYLYNINRWT